MMGVIEVDLPELTSIQMGNDAFFYASLELKSILIQNG